MTSPAAIEHGRILLDLMNDPRLYNTHIFDIITKSPDLTLRNGRDETAVLMAAAMEETDILKALLEAGGNPDDTMPDGNTALIVCIISGDSRAARYLMEAGANPLIRNKHGHDAFDFAELYDQQHIAAIMTEETGKRKARERQERARAAFDERVEKGLPSTSPIQIPKRMKPKGP